MINVDEIEEVCREITKRIRNGTYRRPITSGILHYD